MDLITSKAAKRLYLLRQLKRADVNAKDFINSFLKVLDWKYKTIPSLDSE